MRTQAMVRPRLAERPQLVDSLHYALLACALTGLTAVAMQSIAMTLLGHPWLAYAFPIVAGVYLVAGAIAWRRRPASRMGSLMMLGGPCLLLAGVNTLEKRWLIIVGSLAATWILAVIVHLLLAFPSGQLRTPAARGIVALAWINSAGLQIPATLLPGATGAAWSRAQSILGIVIMAGVAVVLGQRLRIASSAVRRTLIPLYGYGMAVALLIPTASLVLKGLLGLSPLLIFAIQMSGILGAPLAFLAAMLLGSFRQTAEAQALAAWLGSAQDRPAVGDALIRALGDPDVVLAYWVPGRAEYVDAAGVQVALPTGSRRDRDWIPVHAAGEFVGAIVFDPRRSDARSVHEAANVVALAMQGERLTAELRASEAALHRSRARLIEHGDAVRSAIARDLHDGLQVRLLLLGVAAQQLAMSATEDSVRVGATALREEIDQAATELRRLAHQIMPGALEQRGLAIALEDLTDRMPIKTSFDPASVPDPIPSAVALTAYFVVAEGLTNAARYSSATAIRVEVSDRGDDLIVEVHDNGVGAARLEPGSGIGGLRDRVEAVGGTFELVSAVGAGTSIRAVLPCE